mgnify:FL=1
MIFQCLGTGWYDTVPACGVVGKWHVCDVSFVFCVETESSEIAQRCR